MIEKIIIIFLLIAIFLARKIIYRNFHIVFCIYFFLTLVLWSLPRLVSHEDFIYLFNKLGFSKELVTDFYNCSEIFNNNHLRKLLPVYFAVGLFLLYLIYPLFSFAGSKLKGIFSVKTNVVLFSNVHVVFSVLVILLILLVKELLVPYFFVQDDNHVQFFPKILVAMKMLFAGEFPFVDNFQHFGAPIFQIGTYSAVDPLMLLSYLFSKFLLGNVYLTLEVYAFISLATGAFFLGLSFKNLKVDWLVGIAGVISYSLSGYFLIASRSWFYVLGIACYMPILVYFFLKNTSENNNFKNVTLLGILRACFFYAGNAQFFLYGTLIEFISYLYILIKKFSRKVFFTYICSLVFTIGCILPLLIPQWVLLKSLDRPYEQLISYHSAPFEIFVSSILPYPYYLWDKCAVNYNCHLLSNLYHIGFIWVIVLFIGLISYLRNGVAIFMSLLLGGVFLFVLSGGHASILYPFKHYIPVMNRMHYAFKIYPFAELLIIIYGVLVLSKVREIAFIKRVISYVVILGVILVVYVAIYGTDTAFYSYKEKPYPKLSPGVAKFLSKDDLLYGFGPGRHYGDYYANSLVHNYSCVYDIKATNKYDPLLPTMFLDPTKFTDIPSYFNKLGITKALVKKENGSIEWESHSKVLKSFPVLYEDENLVLFDTGVKPWVIRQINDNIRNATSEVTKYDRAKLKTRIYSPEDTVCEYHNEYRDGYYLLVNGKREKVYQSIDGWCAFSLSTSLTPYEIEIGYVPPFFLPALIFGGILILSVIFFYGCVVKKTNLVKS